jgi:hypothetical protein
VKRGGVGEIDVGSDGADYERSVVGRKAEACGSGNREFTNPVAVHGGIGVNRIDIGIADEDLLERGVVGQMRHFPAAILVGEAHEEVAWKGAGDEGISAAS